jgi:hypothetical protein
MGQGRPIDSLVVTIPFGNSSQMTWRDLTTPLSCKGEETVSGYRQDRRVCPLDSLNSSKQELRRGGHVVSLDRLRQPNDPLQLEAKSTHTHQHLWAPGRPNPHQIPQTLPRTRIADHGGRRRILRPLSRTVNGSPFGPDAI